MVYVPELDRQGFADRQRLNREANRPAINFNQRDDIREFAGSGMGQNYHKMMDLQQQAPTFQKNDPRIDELKQRRRQFNRYDKYNAGSIFGETPQHMQEDYRFESNELRNRAKPVYNKMYPLTGAFMDYTEGGGLPGLLIQGARDISGNIQQGLEKKIGDPLRAIGSAILNNDGIGGGLNTNEEELRNYANLTYPQDVHPGLLGDTAELPETNERTRNEQIQALVDEEQRKIDNFETNAYSDILDDAIENQWPNNIEPPLQEEVVVPEEPLPFDDSARERAIMEQYPESFIGPQDDPYRKPDMDDVAGIRSIDRGLFYPGYNDEVTEVPYYGRGEMTQPYEYDFSDFYRNMREGYGEAAEYNLREKELQDALAADEGRSFMTIPPDFDPNRKVFTDNEDYYGWIRDMKKYGFR